MSQVTIRRPFSELDLCDQFWFEPHTVFHLFLGQGPYIGSMNFRAGRLLSWSDGIPQIRELTEIEKVMRLESEANRKKFRNPNPTHEKGKGQREKD